MLDELSLKLLKGIKTGSLHVSENGKNSLKIVADGNDKIIDIIDFSSNIPTTQEIFTRLSEAKKFAKNVYVIKKQSQNEVPIWQSAADFLIIPHPDSEYSQSPMKLFEYLASGRPIVSSELENIKEVLKGERNLFFEAENRGSFMLTIKKYLDNKDEHDKKAKDNIELAKEHTWEKRGQKISEFIKVSLKLKNKI